MSSSSSTDSDDDDNVELNVDEQAAAETPPGGDGDGDGNGDVNDEDGQLYANMPQTSTKPTTTTFTVRHMRVLDWPPGRAFPHDQKTLLTLYSQLVECQKNRRKDRFLIHCL